MMREGRQSMTVHTVQPQTGGVACNHRTLTLASTSIEVVLLSKLLMVTVMAPLLGASSMVFQRGADEMEEAMLVCLTGIRQL